MKNLMFSFNNKNFFLLFTNGCSIFNAHLWLANKCNPRSKFLLKQTGLIFALFLMSADGAALPTYTTNRPTYAAALSDCKYEIASATVDNSKPDALYTVEVIDSCPLVSGYYLGYYNWVTVKYQSRSRATGAIVSELERWYLIDGLNVKKNAGNGGGCDAGEGGNLGCSKEVGAPLVGNPINVATGNKYFEELDYSDNQWLIFRRFYNSSNFVDHANFGERWRHSFDRSFVSSNLSNQALIFIRPDGKSTTYVKSGGQWTADLDVIDSLSEIRDSQSALQGYKLFVAEKDRFEIYSLSGKLLRVEDRNGAGINLSYSDAHTNPAIAPAPGLLLSVINSQGRGLNFTYDSSSRLNQLITPDEGVITYSYDFGNDLRQVQYADGKAQQYLYNEPMATDGANLPHYLTAIIDENNNRYKEVFYDNQGRATVTRRIGGVESVSVAYNSNGSATLQYASGASTTLTPISQLNRNKVASLSQPCSPACDDQWKARFYDSYGFPLWYKDFLDYYIKTVYSAKGLLEQKIEAYATTNQRSTNTSWDNNLRKPLIRSFLNSQDQTIKKQQWVYNPRGQVIANCDINPALAPSYNCSISGTPPAGVRRWTYTYCDVVNSQCPFVGLLLNADGPRTDVGDVTAYTYYTTTSAGNYIMGDLATATNALGQITQYTKYDANGRLLSMTDPNGVVTTMTYTPRGWLKTKTVSTQTTIYDYDGVGQVTKITQPDSSYLSYVYDTAHRLTDISDNNGNKTHYTLDAMSNRIKEETFDPSNALKQTRSRIFDSLNRLQKDIGGTDPTTQITQYSYDNNGNLKTITDPLNHVTTNGYDALNRLITVTDPANGVASTTYNALDQVTQVKDPRLVATNFTIDALGNVTLTQSPDSGSTASVYDAAGNLTQKTDARGVVTNYTYDALNRVTSITYPASTAENVSFTYDSVANGNKGVGRLTGYSNDGGATVLVYDSLGNITTQTEQIGSQFYVTSYQYDSANRITQITYPSDRRVIYTRNALGQITQVQTKDTGSAAAVAIISDATYEPFGPLKTLVYGNAVTSTVLHDADYRVSRITTSSTPVWDFLYSYDAAGNLTQQADQVSTFSKTYGYDTLDRVTSDVNNTGTWTYQYDANGNRTQRVNSATQNLTFATNSNRITKIGTATQTLDAVGNITGSGTKTFAYNNANRLSLVSNNGTVTAQPTYNALSQRTQKLQIAKPFSYHYGQQNELLGITIRYPSGTLYQRVEYLWLDGVTPLAQVRTTYNSNGSVSSRRMTYIHADHLNTPRVMTDSTKKIVWRWDGDAYGVTAPNENPDGDSTTDTLSLRFPGQIADGESGFYYNLNRDYDPATGRYVQSDPIGLNGGLNTYGYVNGNPVSLIDLEGLANSGGPYHPPHGVKVSCSQSDSCPAINGKMNQLERMIRSHQGWDWNNRPPRGGGRHAEEIADLWRAYAKCQALHSQKCKNCPPDSGEERNKTLIPEEPGVPVMPMDSYPTIPRGPSTSPARIPIRVPVLVP